MLPAGPTVIDMLANSAFYYGMLRTLSEEDRPLWTKMSFAAAQQNFVDDARHGMQARLYWPGLGAVSTEELVLTELLQNALQHGFGALGPRACADGIIEVLAARAPEQLTVTVSDSGAGIPPGFDLENTSSLGLQIVRTLVVAELGGRLSIAPRPGGGTVAVVDLPVRYEPQPRQG